ncbi:MAG: GtrA family protein [Bacteroidia bacterium]
MDKGFFHWFPKVQFWRYVVVGGGGTLWDIGWYGFLRYVGLAHWPSLALSFGSGVILGFLFSRWWVFQQSGNLPAQLLRFLAVIAFMYLLNGLIMAGLYKVIGGWKLQGWIVRGFSAALTFPLSYLLHRRISFA